VSKPRKKWEPEYRFGGNPADHIRPNVLGDNRIAYKPTKTKKRKK